MSVDQALTESISNSSQVISHCLPPDNGALFFILGYIIYLFGQIVCYIILFIYIAFSNPLSKYIRKKIKVLKSKCIQNIKTKQ